ncbi:hypothetical protein DL765_009483 [Monosporascus sp. GIB2]|nr:hypothetical protein DL765_009483 [Monosporascus sp. GIB2]
MTKIHEYNYVFVIGIFFAMLYAYNNGASNGIRYHIRDAWGDTRRRADGRDDQERVVPNAAFQENPGVQMLAFTCALAAASSWVMWCTRNSTHVSPTYSLISAVAGVGIATAGAWQGPRLSSSSSPGTACTLSIVCKGSPNLGLNKKPSWYIAAVNMGTGCGVPVLSAIFFVPFLARGSSRRKDYTVKWYMFVMGSLSFSRETPADPDHAQNKVPNYAVVQHDDLPELTATTMSLDENESGVTPILAPSREKATELAVAEFTQLNYKALVAHGEERFHPKPRKKRRPLGWAMRVLHDNPMGAGQVYELRNVRILARHIRRHGSRRCTLRPALRYPHDAGGYRGHARWLAHASGAYAHAEKYPTEIEHTSSFVQILTACTASFAHGADNIGNSAGP